MNAHQIWISREVSSEGSSSSDVKVISSGVLLTVEEYTWDTFGTEQDGKSARVNFFGLTLSAEENIAGTFGIEQDGKSARVISSVLPLTAEEKVAGTSGTELDRTSERVNIEHLPSLARILSQFVSWEDEEGFWQKELKVLGLEVDIEVDDESCSVRIRSVDSPSEFLTDVSLDKNQQFYKKYK